MRKDLFLKFFLALFILSSPVSAQDNPGAAKEEKGTNALKDPGYTVGVSDVLNIAILQPEQLVTNVTVAPDGGIEFPYVGSLVAKGKSLKDIQLEIEKRLSEGYMKYPVVSVGLIESRSRKFFVYGEVIKPGTYPLEENVTVLRAIAMAEGFTKFGSAERVKVLRLRKNGVGYDTINVNLKNVLNFGWSDEDIILQPGDIVVVSEGAF